MSYSYIWPFESNHYADVALNMSLTPWGGGGGVVIQASSKQLKEKLIVMYVHNVNLLGVMSTE